MDDGTALIELRRRKGASLWAVVDSEDYERVSRHRWHALRRPHTTYAQGNVYVDGLLTLPSLHRFIMNPGPGLVVDHVDHDGLNNRRSNLRVATWRLNLGNMRTTRDGVSRYKGVSWEPGRAKGWGAQIGIDNRSVRLGRFYTETEAALAYDTAAREVFGEFALVNFPDADSPQSGS